MPIYQSAFLVLVPLLLCQPGSHSDAAACSSKEGHHRDKPTYELMMPGELPPKKQGWYVLPSGADDITLQVAMPLYG